MPFTGWYPKKHYPLNRPLTEDEKKERLPQRPPLYKIPYPWLEVLRANGTFIECAERSQEMRGSFIVLVMTVASFLLYLAIGAAFYDSFTSTIRQLFSPTEVLRWPNLIFAFFIELPMLVGFAWVTLPFIRYNMFSYRYFPRRFNCKNRQVYVFNRDGSVTKLPFDEVFWHIGHGGLDKDLIDLRGHQLDADGNVIFTFSASFLQEQFLQQHMIFEWFDFITIYMDKGLDGVAENDWDRVISYKYGANWKGCKVDIVNRYRNFYPYFFWFVPIHTAFYWLSMKLSKEPKWPQWVEDECAIDPNDPPPWPEPEYSGQFDLRAREPAYYDHLADRMHFPEDSPERKMLKEEGTRRWQRVTRNWKK